MDLDDMFGAFDPAAGNSAAKESKDGSAMKPRKQSSQGREPSDSGKSSRKRKREDNMAEVEREVQGKSKE